MLAKNMRLADAYKSADEIREAGCGIYIPCDGVLCGLEFTSRKPETDQVGSTHYFFRLCDDSHRLMSDHGEVIVTVGKPM